MVIDQSSKKSAGVSELRLDRQEKCYLQLVAVPDCQQPATVICQRTVRFVNQIYY